jgi:putative membrane protein
LKLSAISNKVASTCILSVSAIAISFLVWLIYFNSGVIPQYPTLSHLPALNACLNALSATFMVLGVRAIKKGKKEVHKKWMLSAFLASALFLVGYIVHHAAFGDSLFAGLGAIRMVYFFILGSHIILTLFALPLILMTFFLALTNRLEGHKKIAKWTFPLWMYVSITGVLIFGFLRLWGG